MRGWGIGRWCLCAIGRWVFGCVIRGMGACGLCTCGVHSVYVIDAYPPTTANTHTQTHTVWVGWLSRSCWHVGGPPHTTHPQHSKPLPTTPLVLSSTPHPTMAHGSRMWGGSCVFLVHHQQPHWHTSDQGDTSRWEMGGWVEMDGCML